MGYFLGLSSLGFVGNSGPLLESPYLRSLTCGIVRDYLVSKGQGHLMLKERVNRPRDVLKRRKCGTCKS